MGSAAKEAGLYWVFGGARTLAGMAAGGDPGLGEVTDRGACVPIVTLLRMYAS